MVSELIPGLSQNESLVYNAVLKIKEASVRDISKVTGIHRTYIYDVIEKLKEKGLIVYFKEGKINYYKCSDPANLYNNIENQIEDLDKIMPQFQEKYKQARAEIDIEIFKGKNGIINAYKDIIREGKPVMGLGISRKLEEYLPIFRTQFFREIKRKNIKFELIYSKKLKPLGDTFTSRYLLQQFESPIEILFYGDKTLQIIWEPELRAILIKSQMFTDTYIKHFNILWKQAKKM